MIEIDLEKVALELKWFEKHADRLILTKKAIIVVEETRGRARKDNLDKIANTVRELRGGRLREYLYQHYRDYLPKRRDNVIVGIVHTEKEVDMLVKEYMINLMKIMQVACHIVHCGRELQRKIQEYNPHDRQL